MYPVEVTLGARFSVANSSGAGSLLVPQMLEMGPPLY